MFKLLTFAAFGGIGYAAYSFYEKNGRVPNLNELVDTVKTLTNAIGSSDAGSKK